MICKTTPLVISSAATRRKNKKALKKKKRKGKEKRKFTNQLGRRGSLVGYTQTVETEEDPYGVEMVQAAASCRICVVRKRETMPDRSIRMVTSIWAFSDDNTVRFQQKLADGELYVPYSSYFSPEKISVTVPTEVKFYGIRYGTKPAKVQKTSWINYVFADVKSKPISLPILDSLPTPSPVHALQSSHPP